MDKKAPLFSLIVPFYNAVHCLPLLVKSLANKTFQNFEVVFVDDHSTDFSMQIIKQNVRSNMFLIRLEKNRGPAVCRNLGANQARGDYLVFTDSDCEAEPDWLAQLQHAIADAGAAAIMGKLMLRSSNFIGDSISALGFPAGGAIGFDKIWRVDAGGFTRSLSTCNCAIQRNVFMTLGGFDESFPYPGGEDSLLAYRLVEAGYRIQYVPQAQVWHAARDSVTDFIRWQFRRGVSSYIFARKVSRRKAFIGLRLWSTRNILAAYWRDARFPLVMALLGMSTLIQLGGFLYGRHKKIA